MTMYNTQIKEAKPKISYWKYLVLEVTQKDVARHFYLSNIHHIEPKEYTYTNNTVNNKLYSFGSYCLTANEALVCYLYLKGLTIKAINKKLKNLDKRAQNHITNIKEKIGTRTKMQLLHKLQTNGFKEKYKKIFKKTI